MVQTERVRPSVETQYAASIANTMAEPDMVADGIWSIPLAMPDPRNPYSLCYAIEGADGSLHLLDPGYNTDENWNRLSTALRQFGHDPHAVASVFISHLHPDHLGLAERVRGASGSTVMMLAREQRAALRLAEGSHDIEATLDAWGVPPHRHDELHVMLRMSGRSEATRADVTLEDGDLWNIPGRALKLLWTPGHTPGHACVIGDLDRVLFTGDHVLPKIYPGLGLGGATDTNPIADYFQSLDRIANYDSYEVAPGHAYRFFGLSERIDQIKAHHLKRSREAAAIIAREPGATVFEVASQLRWTLGWQNMTGFFLYSALSQTALHLEFLGSGGFSD
ncbi:MAG: hypothetical protein JWO98_2178 [Frankiales bacterium]|nr:hypothetical protein [Frankiales bacterium]